MASASGVSIVAMKKAGIVTGKGTCTRSINSEPKQGINKSTQMGLITVLEEIISNNLPVNVGKR